MKIRRAPLLHGRRTRWDRLLSLSLQKFLEVAACFTAYTIHEQRGATKWIAFRLFQRSHTMITKSSALNSSLQNKKQASNSLNEVGCGGAVWWSHSNVDQAPVIASQYHTAWRESSGKLWHCAQLGLGTMLRQWRLTNVGSALLHILHTKCLLLLGTRSCQMLF